MKSLVEQFALNEINQSDHKRQDYKAKAYEWEDRIKHHEAKVAEQLEHKEPFRNAPLDAQVQYWEILKKLTLRERELFRIMLNDARRDGWDSAKEKYDKSTCKCQPDV